MLEILLDAATIGQVEETPWGFLRIPARMGAEGVVTYTLRDGSKRREFRPKEEVLKLDSLHSYSGAPVTGRHPYDEPTNLILPENVKKHFVGVVGDMVRGGDAEGVAVVDGSIMLMDADEIKNARAGKVALSPGYTRRLDMTPGVWKNPKTGESVAYDAVQRDIRVNHVTICEKGRQGPLVRLRLDSANEEVEFAVNMDAVEVEKPKEAQGGSHMKKVKVNGVEHEVHDDVAAQMDSVTSENTTLKAKVTTLETEKKTALDSAAAAEAKADTAVKALETEKGKKPSLDSIPVEQRHAAAERRLRILSVAQGVLPKDQHKGFSAMSDMDLMKKVIVADSAETPAEKLAMDAYVEARFDAICETRQKAGKDLSKLESVLDEGRQETSGAQDREARMAARRKAVMDASTAPLKSGATCKK